MIQIETTSHDPFFNQAFEDYVFRTYREGDVLLLWRNRPAVVVGCYQNICREVHMRALLDRGIPVVRRMSGGGTVYHDLGNLNYTLISDQTGPLDYDRCLEPVIRALNALGVPAQKNRTCDIAVDGKKSPAVRRRSRAGASCTMGRCCLIPTCRCWMRSRPAGKTTRSAPRERNRPSVRSRICALISRTTARSSRSQSGWRSSCCRPARSRSG